MLHAENPIAAAPLEPIALPDIPNPAPGTAEYVAAKVRDRARYDISAMPWLPQGPDDWMNDIYDRVEAAERKYVTPHLRDDEYKDGTARRNDDIAHVSGRGNFLFTAPHATKAMRVANGGKLGFADKGTAGMTAVLAEEFGDGFIVTGRQTKNPVANPEHPLKDAVRPYVPAATGFVDVHASASHLFVRPTDRYNVHASLGLGENPSQALREFGHAVMRYARNELGLYVIIGNEQEYYSQRSPAELKRNEDGSAYRHRLAGSRPNMMNNFVRRELAAAGRVAPALQVELSAFNLVSPIDSTLKRDRRTRVIAVALGYKLFEHIVERALNEPPETL